MTIYFIITKEDDYNTTLLVTLGEGSYYDKGCLFSWYEAPTRGKAKYMFCKEHDLEFTTPVETQKVIDCDVCFNEGYGDEYNPGECPKCKGKSYRPDDVRVWKEKA